MKEGAYKILWFAGDVSPTSVDGIYEQDYGEDEDNETTGNDGYEDDEDDTIDDDDQDDGD